MKLSDTEPYTPVHGGEEPTWEQMTTDQRLYALLVLINSLGKISEIQSEAIAELQDRLQTLELQGVV